MACAIALGFAAHALLRHRFRLHFKSDSTVPFFPRECRTATAGLMWTQSPTESSSTGTQSTPTIAASKLKTSRLAKLSEADLGESSKPLALQTFIETLKKRDLNVNAETKSRTGVTKKNSVSAGIKSKGSQTQKMTIASNMKTIQNVVYDFSPAPARRKTSG